MAGEIAQATVVAEVAEVSTSISAGGGVWLRIGKQLVLTPTGVLELQDVFGLNDYANSPECVACMTEPKDTILLPCRHLCVCRTCFNHLTLDKCPVCRAPFTSYLRFDAAATGADEGASVDEEPVCRSNGISLHMDTV